MTRIRTFVAACLLMSATCAYAQTDASAWIIPQSVAWMYVWLQDPNRSGPGARQELAADLPQAQFAKNIGAYIERARAAKMKLVIAAQDAERKWVPSGILYRGVPLQRARDVGGGPVDVVPGLEVPTE